MKKSSLIPVTRREFCARACQAGSLTAAGVLLTACGGSPSGPSSISATPLPTVTGVTSGRTIAITIDASSALASVGSLAMVQTSLGTFLLSRTAADSFSAMTATCTHQACTINGFDGSRFVCPCHGSQFSTTGAVVNGPAPSPLRQYVATFTNNVLTFTV